MSVIVCTYDIDRYHDFIDSINSLRNQSYGNIEIVVVVDGDRKLYEKVLANQDIITNNITIILNEKNLGLSESRNRGIEVAKGEVIAFFDDDAIADKNWVRELVKMYDTCNAIAAGGKLIPHWIDKKVDFLPEEYFWLIGATHKGFPEQITEVRNTFGSNISFRSSIIKALGGFKSELGVHAEKRKAFQGEEAEYCIRMKQRFGKGVTYNPQAVVYHKIPGSRVKIRFLLKRAFWQGYSKRVMEQLAASGLNEERNFMNYLVFESIPDRVNGILRTHSLTQFNQLIFLLVLTGVTGFGYLIKTLKS